LLDKSIFLILSTNTIGGAEKRFAGLWHSVNEGASHVNLYLVCSKQLLAVLKTQESLGTSVTNNRKVIEYDFSGGFTNFQKATRSFITKYTRDGDVLHFVGDHPLSKFRNRQIVYSITQSSFKNLNLYGKLGQIGGVMFSNIIDVLDPTIYKFLKRVYFYKRSKIYQTSNSYSDVKLSSGPLFELKKDWFVFLGRFEKMKQVTRLLNAVPSLYQSLRGCATNNLHFYFLGHGSLERELQEMLSEVRFQDIPITVKYHSHPYEVLQQSKFFFSLQLYNNYPSRSLLEALATGNIPIVTDVGQSRWLAKPEFSYYVPEHFTEEDLLDVVKEVYGQDESILAAKSALAREFVLKEHTIEKMRNYYLALYNRL
jgi:glycosyltransferase involved in cell wall biosynthesis